MRTFRYAAAAAAAAAIGLLPAVSASAAGTVLTYGSAGGTSVAVGDVLTSSLVPGTYATLYTTTTGTTGIKCAASTFSATVTDNPAAPGTATESLTGQTFSSCTTNFTGTTGVRSVTIGNLPRTTTVASGGVVTVAGPVNATLSLNSVLGTVTCNYTASSLTGTASNTDNSITFTNQGFTLVSGSSLCPSIGYWSAKYAPVSGPGGNVYVN
jgi:hypothetical protein